MGKGKLIIVVGQSGSGKTKLANEIILTGCMLNDNKTIPSNIWPEDEEYVSCLAEIVNDSNNSTYYASKYVTRDIRKDDVGVIKSTKEGIEKECDIVIPGYKEGDLIGINSDEIIEQIDQGKCLVLVTGFMDLLQLILRRLYELGRLDDVFIVGINGFLKDEETYESLEQSRYDSSEQSVIESADSRFKHSRLFARQFMELSDILDWTVDNYRMKYVRDKDLRDEGTIIYNAANHLLEKRDDKKINAIVDFISCDLSEFVPVKNEEIKHI